ncbi:hypothetical protein GCM10022233_71200 [Streptomyces shaanxiensis]|uniref:Uncharacterized protein n=1 Tax=Streptomyces shaanxiensis TaxID=653357 RepID=A0ABP7W419_9ACTN
MRAQRGDGRDGDDDQTRGRRRGRREAQQIDQRGHGEHTAATSQRAEGEPGDGTGEQTEDKGAHRGEPGRGDMAW